jgi:TPR repeat protein
LPFDWFVQAQPSFDQNVMQRLLDRGWIRLNPETDVLSIHPLVYKTARTELKHTVASSGRFLEGIWDIFEQHEGEKLVCRPIGKMFSGIPDSFFLGISAEWLEKLDNWFDRVVAWYDKTIEEMENLIDWTDRLLEGCELFREGDLEQALQHFKWCEANSIPTEYEKCLYEFMLRIYLEWKQYPEAFRYAGLLMKYDDPGTYTLYACMLLYGRGCDRDLSAAITYFEKAAEHPQAPSRLANEHLGALYLGEHKATSDFSPIDPEKALSYRLRAKELGAENVDGLIEKAKEMLDL